MAAAAEIQLLDASGPGAKHAETFTIDDFVLNKRVSLKKKLEACKRPDVSFNPYEGGIIIDFSTGFYEAVKAGMNDFFDVAAENLDLCPKWRRDMDRNSAAHRDVLQVKSLDGMHEYTVQMFHTTTRMQVNGKLYTNFLIRDLLRLQPIIRHYAAKMSTPELNKQLAEVIKNMLSIDDANTESKLNEFLHTYRTDGNPMKHKQNAIAGPGGDKQDKQKYQAPEKNSNAEQHEEIEKKDTNVNDNMATSIEQTYQCVKPKTNEKHSKHRENVFYCLTRGCKYGRHERNGVAMIQCSICFTYFHHPCTGDDEVILQDCVIFTCKDCRTMPHRIYNMMTDIEELQTTVASIPNDSQTINLIKGKLHKLEGDIRQLTSAVNKLQNTLQEAAKQPPVVIQKPVTLSGYSEAVKENQGKTQNKQSNVKQDSKNPQTTIGNRNNTRISMEKSLTEETQLEDWTLVSKKKRNKQKRSTSEEITFIRSTTNHSTPKPKQKSTETHRHAYQRHRMTDQEKHRAAHDGYTYKRRYKHADLNTTKSKSRNREYSHYRYQPKFAFTEETRQRGWIRDDRENRNGRYHSEEDNRYRSDQYSYYTRRQEDQYNEYGRHYTTTDGYYSFKESCKNCGEAHRTSQCWHNQPIRCRVCRCLGHKEKHCDW